MFKKFNSRKMSTFDHCNHTAVEINAVVFLEELECYLQLTCFAAFAFLVA